MCSEATVAERGWRRAYRGSLLRFPGSLDDVTIWIPTLDAHVGRLVRHFNEFDTVVNKPIAKCKNGLSARKANTAVHPRWAIDGLRATAQREREAGGVVEHQNPIVIVLGRPRAEPEVGLVEASRACLIRHRDCQVVHPRYVTARRPGWQRSVWAAGYQLVPTQPPGLSVPVPLEHVRDTEPLVSVTVKASPVAEELETRV